MSSRDAFPTDRSVMTDVIHARIHQSLMFSAQVFEQTLANNDTLDMLIRPAQLPGLDDSERASMHLRGFGRVGGDATLRAWRSKDRGAPVGALAPISRTADGAEVFVENRNQFTDRLPGALINKDPTLTDPVNPTPFEIEAAFEFIAGGTGGFLSAGASQAIWQEWILRTDSEYLLRITNISGAAQPAQIQIDWYEPIQRVL